MLKEKTRLAIPILLIVISLGIMVNSVVAISSVEAIVTGRAYVMVDGIRTSGRAVFDIDLVDTSIKFEFGDYTDDPWTYGWNITEVFEQGKNTYIIAIPADVGDGTVPGPVNILIAIRSLTTIEEGTKITAMGRDFATRNSLSFSGEVLELDV
jgi:hypothetical protein